MAPLPVISNVYRITINYASANGIAPRNVFHLRSPSGDVTEIADRITDAAQDQPMMTGMSPDFTPPNFSIIPLDGSTATSVHDFPEGCWSTNSSGGQISPASAAIVSFRTGIRGPRGRGRVFIGPLNEDTIEDGFFIGDNLNDLPNAWIEFATALATGDPAMVLGVASYVHEDFEALTTINTPQLLGTMRRRQDQLR